MIKEQRILKHSRKKKIESEAKKIEMESRWKPAKKGNADGRWLGESQSKLYSFQMDTKLQRNPGTVFFSNFNHDDGRG